LRARTGVEAALLPNRPKKLVSMELPALF